MHADQEKGGQLVPITLDAARAKLSFELTFEIRRSNVIQRIQLCIESDPHCKAPHTTPPM